MSASPSEATPVVAALLVNGAAAVNILKPNGACKAFAYYASQVHLPYIRTQLQAMERTDLVSDKYVSDGLESTTRSSRGQGVRRRVEPDVKLPGDWNSFLRVDNNKTELFKYLAEQTITIQDEGKEVLSTCHCPVTVLFRPTRKRTWLTFLLVDMKRQIRGFYCMYLMLGRKVMLRTVDTDIVVLALSFPVDWTWRHSGLLLVLRRHSATLPSMRLL